MIIARISPEGRSHEQVIAIGASMISVKVNLKSQTIDALRREHTNMRSVLMLVGRQLDLMESEVAVDHILLANALYYMRKFPSLVHHPKEDAIFERLADLDPSWKQEVEKLREQHQDIYRLEDWLIETTLDMPKPGTIASDRLIEFGREYLQVQRLHSETEERVLFPKALETFKGDDWATIAGRFAAIDDPLFGEHSGERYRLLHDYIMREASGQ